MHMLVAVHPPPKAPAAAMEQAAPVVVSSESDAEAQPASESGSEWELEYHSELLVAPVSVLVHEDMEEEEEWIEEKEDEDMEEEEEQIEEKEVD